jgi:hypothetical protein
MILHIRFYVDVSTIEEAQTVASMVAKQIEPIARLIDQNIQKYWKIETLYEVRMNCHSTQEDKTILLRNAVNHLGGSWNTTISTHTNRAIWNKKDGCLVTCER